jgi:Spy/CpxP family protein refolding chaperone
LRLLNGIHSVSKIEHNKQKEKRVQVHSKAALIALALVLSCSPIFAQGDPADPPSDSSGSSSGMGPGGGMRRGGPGRDGAGRGRGMGMRGGMRGREFGLGRLLSDPDIRTQLGVSAEQAATIRQQESDFRKTAIRSRADVQVKQIDLRDLMSADKPDRAAIDAKLQEISTARLAFEKSAVDYRLNARDALTPAQRDKLRQIMRDRRGRGGDGGSRGPRGPRGMGPGGQRGSAPPAKPQGQTPPTQ